MSEENKDFDAKTALVMVHQILELHEQSIDKLESRIEELEKRIKEMESDGK